MLTSLRRSLGRPGLLGALLVAATLGLAGALAYQAAGAAESHRTAVETALEQHATAAAWHFAGEARGWLGFGMNNAGDALRRDVTPRAVLPGPEVLQRLLAQKYCDCMTAGFGRTFVRVVAGDSASLDLLGEPLSERARDDLRDTMLALVGATQMQRDARRWRILSPGTPRLNRSTDAVLLWRFDDPAHRRHAAYGMVVERAQLERPLIGALENAQFFPSSVVSGAAAKSLVRVQVAGRNGATIFAAGPTNGAFAGSDTVGVDYGNLIATAAINPDGARILVAGGVPASRVPMILSLLVLSLAMGVASALLLRREHRLARLREDFVSGVSHELRTPLTQIRMLSELLETDGFKSAAERTRAVGVIHRESLRLTNLVDNILEFTRLRRAVVARNGSVVQLGEVLREVADALGPLLDARSNRLEVIAAENVAIRGERDAVSRVLRNLIENAAKYGPSSQTIRMTVKPHEHGSAVRITVDDEGPGVPPDERSRIWKPYYRLDRDRNASAGGSGLGLSVVADLVQSLGGHASVGDAPSGGARFTVDLPGVEEHVR